MIYILKQKRMTIKKLGFSALCLLITFGLCRLITMSVDAAWWGSDGFEYDKSLKMDLGNNTHQMEAVKLISRWDDSSEATIRSVGQTNLVWIQTNNFVISKSDNSSKNLIEWGSNNSNILWWIKNVVKGAYSSILWWENNTNKWDYSTILWWIWNKIKEDTNESNYSTILWWSNNTVEWNGSVIAWWRNNKIEWDYSAVVWVNNTVEWDYSVALWRDSKVSANNSFLWTDGSQSDKTLQHDNVFAVVSQHGMVVNADKAHPYAQLTIWWPLIISKSSSDVVKCDVDHSGVLKVVDGNGGRTCLCSCDGRDWNSLYGEWTCQWRCNTKLEPKCGNVYKCSSWTKRYFKWTCTDWEVIQWQWAYIVTRDDKVHRTCQTKDGKTLQCEDVAKSPTWSECIS